MQQHVLIVPIAFDLERKSDEVVVGPGTKCACDHAIVIARAEVEAGNTPRLLTTATRAGEAYRHVMMGSIMREYLSSHAPEIACDFVEATEFSTLGEILRVADYTRHAWLDFMPTGLERVVFTVKSWHAWRLRMIVRKVFKKRGIAIPFEIKTHPFKVRFGIRLREVAAYAQNWVRITRMT